MLLIAIEHLGHRRARHVAVGTVPVVGPVPAAIEAEGTILEGGTIADFAALRTCPVRVCDHSAAPLPIWWRHAFAREVFREPLPHKVEAVSEGRDTAENIDFWYAPVS